MPEQANLVEHDGGFVPASEGWFVVNAHESLWWRSDDFGATAVFQGRDHFREVGVNIHVIWPGRPSAMYHAENAQEDFLVVAGECLLLIEEEERPLKAWDYVHCPAWTKHIFVGAGDGPCVIVMIGRRRGDEEFLYPVSELAQKHGAGVPEETGNPDEAYSRFGEGSLGTMPDGALPG